MPQLIDSPAGPVNNASAVVQVAPPAPLTDKNAATAVNYSSPVSSKILTRLRESTPPPSPPSALPVPVRAADASAAAAVPTAPALGPSATFIKSRADNNSSSEQRVIVSKTKSKSVSENRVVIPHSKKKASPDAYEAPTRSMQDSVDQLMKKSQLLEESDMFYGGRSGFRLRRNIVSSSIKSELKKQEKLVQSLDEETSTKLPWYKRMANSIQKTFSKNTPATPVVVAAPVNDVEEDEWLE